jgi:hypothetical protein
VKTHYIKSITVEDMSEAEIRLLALAMQWTEHGTLYGYPECCRTAFCGMMLSTPQRQPKPGPWTGSGFIPCPDCRRLIAEIGLEKYVEKFIMPNRKFEKPFPIDAMGAPENYKWPPT